VALRFGCDRGGFDAQAMLIQSRRRVVNDLITGIAAFRQRKIEVKKVEIHADYVGFENAQGFHEKLLPGLITVQYDNRAFSHSKQNPFESQLRLAARLLMRIRGRRGRGGCRWRSWSRRGR